MVSTAIASTKDARKGELVLRIRGTSRHGQIVRLQAEKCTIGSGPRCTLRLRARGVQPLHCLIVRGPAAAVIRRWHPDTRLNGHAFSESLLSPGDRLSVGPLEFEVLEAVRSGEASDAVETRPSEADEAEAESTVQNRERLHRQHEELEQQRQELDSLAVTLNQREQSLTESVARLNAREAELQARQHAWEEECRQQKAETTDAEQSAAGQQSELEARLQALEEERRQWDTQRGAAEKALAEQTAQLETLQAELAAQRQAFEQQCAKWETERAEAEKKLQTWQAELEAQRQSLDEERQREETEEANDAAECSNRLAELSAREAELEAQQRAFEESRQRWEAERSNSETQLHTRREELKIQQAECESRQRSLEEQRQRWETERAEAERNLNARQAEFEAQRQSLDNERQRQQAEWDEIQEELLRRREELDARQAELEAARETLEEERRQWEAERAKAESRQPDDDREEEPVLPRQPSGQSPLSSLEILRRMGNMPEFSDDDSEESARPAAQSPSSTGHSAQGHPPRATHADNEEESIDDYMARLLERVRGVAGETAASSQPSRNRRKEEPAVRETIPIQSAAESAAPRPVANKRREAVELSPRAVAPEKFVDLTAMRELANLSAQTAIDRHSRRVLRRVVVTKLIVAILGLLGGVALLGIWRTVPNGLTFSAAMASFVVGLFWGIQYFVLMAPRFRRRREREEGQRTKDDGRRAAEEEMAKDENQMTKEIENTKHE